MYKADPREVQCLLLTLCMSRRTTVLLDVDGTLVDSNDLHAEAWVELLKGQGFPASFAQVRPLIGMGGDKLLPLLTGHSKEDREGKQLSELRTKLFMERYLPRVKALPGARALLESLRARGLRLVVATSANESELAGLLQRGGIDDLLPDRTSSDDADSSKPEPDIVLAALRKARCQPHEALMVGDTPYDRDAAHGANVAFIGLRSGGYDDDALRGALAVYASPSDLLDQLEGSPLAP